mgnify:CR=1 FL=1
MKILIDDQIFSEQKFGGISRYFAELARGMSLDLGVTVRVPDALCTNQYLRQIKRPDRNGLCLPEAIGSGRIIRAMNRAYTSAYARRFSPDIVHESYYPSRNRRWPAGSKIVTTVHDMIHELYPDNFLAIDRTPEFKQRAVENADLVICVSENTRSDLVRMTGLDAGKAVVVHHGADHLGAEPRPRPELKDKPYLLYVGSRAGYKNFSCLLEAFTGEQYLWKNWDLVCFGGGPMTPTELSQILEAAAPSANVIQVDGGDATLCALYQHAAAFVYPSMYEGFGIPPLEAMSQGCPVISSNVSSMPEVLGNAAEFFPPDDSRALKESIMIVLSDEHRREELVSRGSAHVKEFTWQKCAEQTLAAYRQAV